MQKRSTKWYRKNEEEVMKRIGFTPTINSGATWISKGDGESEHCLCELKSTDHESFSIKQSVLHHLEAQAIEAHKLPVFAFQFINTDEVWVAIKESDIEAFKVILQGQEIKNNFDISLDETEEKIYNDTRKQGNTKENLKARMAYMKQREQEREQNNREFKRMNKERRKENQWRKN